MRVLRVAAALAFVALPFLAHAGEPKLDEIVAKNLEARGGAEKIKAIKSARMSGKMTMGGMEMPFVMEFKRPESLRMEFSLQGMTGIQAYDGKGGWQVMPFTGRTDAEPLAGDELKDIKDQADMDGALLDWKGKGHKVEMVGKEEVEGTEAYKLKITKANGDVVTTYLDTEYFLEFKQEQTRKINGQEVKIASAIGDYKEIEGLNLPFSVSSSFEGLPGGQAITLEKVEFNVDIADARFVMPKVEKAAATEPTPAKSDK